MLSKWCKNIRQEKEKMGDVMGKLDKVAQQTQRQVTVDFARR